MAGSQRDDVRKVAVVAPVDLAETTDHHLPPASWSESSTTVGHLEQVDTTGVPPHHPGREVVNVTRSRSGEPNPGARSSELAPRGRDFIRVPQIHGRNDRRTGRRVRPVPSRG